jgi:hypothetical protein
VVDASADTVMEAFGVHSWGSPESWPGAVRDALEPCDLALLGSVTAGVHPFASTRRKKLLTQFH